MNPKFLTETCEEDSLVLKSNLKSNTKFISFLISNSRGTLSNSLQKSKITTEEYETLKHQTNKQNVALDVQHLHRKLFASRAFNFDLQCLKSSENP